MIDSAGRLPFAGGSPGAMPPALAPARRDHRERSSQTLEGGDDRVPASGMPASVAMPESRPTGGRASTSRATGVLTVSIK
jgi:hypothetical protein